MYNLYTALSVGPPSDQETVSTRHIKYLYSSALPTIKRTQKRKEKQEKEIRKKKKQKKKKKFDRKKTGK